MGKAVRIVLVLLVLGVGIAAGGGYGHVQLEKTRRALESEIQGLEDLNALLKKKYAEQKALNGQFMRAKAQMEGRQRALQKELDEARAELESASGGEAALRAEARKKEGEIATLNRRVTEIERHLEEERKKQKQMTATHEAALKEAARERAALERTRDDLEADLGRSRREMERCREHNSRLCTIARELVEKYENKGVADALAQKEPFTQVERVEVEKLVQEYLDRIDDEKLKQ